MFFVHNGCGTPVAGLWDHALVSAVPFGLMFHDFGAEQAVQPADSDLDNHAWLDPGSLLGPLPDVLSSDHGVVLRLQTVVDFRSCEEEALVCAALRRHVQQFSAELDAGQVLLGAGEYLG